MNQQQKNYTMKRLDQILDRKLEPLLEKHTTEEVSLTMEEKWTMILAGSAVAQEDPCIDEYRPDIDSIYDFSMHEIEHSVDRDSLQKDENELKDHCQKLKDEIMLGSADEAIGKIADFEALSLDK